MNLSIISVGNKPNKWELEGINHYLKQLNNQVKIDFININVDNPNYLLTNILYTKRGISDTDKVDESFLFIIGISAKQIKKASVFLDK